MEKQFIPYEEAMSLKELGFDEPCFGWYNWTGKNLYISDNSYVDINPTSAPLWQQAFDWFRKKYGLESYINPELPFSYKNPEYTVIFIKTVKKFITYSDNTIWINEGVQRKTFKTYEEAQLACLKKLIEIVKK